MRRLGLIQNLSCLARSTSSSDSTETHFLNANKNRPSNSFFFQSPILLKRSNCFSENKVDQTPTPETKLSDFSLSRNYRKLNSFLIGVAVFFAVLQYASWQFSKRRAARAKFIRDKKEEKIAQIREKRAKMDDFYKSFPFRRAV